LLNLIRTHQPISRAELSRCTGIFRSNISRIMDELIEGGFVIEKRGSPGGRGRLPMHLELRNESYQVLGVSVQPLQARMALAGLSGRIQKVWTLPTPQTPAAFVKELGREVQMVRKDLRLAANSAIRRVGIAFPGLIHHDTGKIIWAPALPQYSGFALAEELTSRIGIPVSADNDCNLAALSELWLSPAEGKQPLTDFVLLSIGDLGVGAGMVADGKLYRGHDSSFVAEFGHMIIDPDGPRCSCGRNGCWELYISNKATWDLYRPRRPFQAGCFDELLDCAVRGDSRAVHALETTARYIALGASNITFALNPSTIVLAGQITKVWRLIEKTLESAFSSPRIKMAVRPPRFVAEDSLLHGAVWLALSRAYMMPQFGPTTVGAEARPDN
jgi:predicted NBD/HSP70 family sugar kinase